MAGWVNVAGKVAWVSPGGAAEIPGTPDRRKYDQVVWGVNPSGVVFALGVFGAELTGWQQIPGALARVAVSARPDSSGKCQVWGVGPKKEVFKLGSSNEARWERVPAILDSISVGGKGVWGINDKYEIFEYSKAAWKAVKGKLSCIAVSDTDVWGTSPTGQVFKLEDSMFQRRWRNMSGELLQVSVGGRFLCGVNKNREAFFSENGERWYPLVGGPRRAFKQCATNGLSFWAVDVENSVWLWSS